MGLKIRALVDPPRQRRFLGVGKVLARRGGRHSLVGVGGVDSANQLALAALIRHNRDGVAFKLCPLAVLRIKSQTGLAIFVVEAVAFEALVGQDRPHIAIEIDALAAIRGRQSTRRSGQHQQANERQAKHPSFSKRRE
jgi:hypothetical protein